MRTIDEIIAESQKATEAALREAFEAGRAAAHGDLKSKFSAFFSELMAPFETNHAASPVAEHHEEHHTDNHQY